MQRKERVLNTYQREGRAYDGADDGDGGGGKRRR